MVYNYSMDEERLQEYITTSQAAKILGVSVYRIHQFIREPCPDCGETQYQGVGNEVVVTQLYEEGGCERCNWTGVRLPTYGKFERSNAWRLKREDLERLKDRQAGYPKGKKRRKEVRR
jgi:hypothetical protein